MSLQLPKGEWLHRLLTKSWPSICGTSQVAQSKTGQRGVGSSSAEHPLMCCSGGHNVGDQSRNSFRKVSSRFPYGKSFYLPCSKGTGAGGAAAQQEMNKTMGTDLAAVKTAGGC
jgi:hypothetical protein